MRLSDVDVVSESGSSRTGTTANATRPAQSPIAAMAAPDRRMADAVSGPTALEAAGEATDFQSVRPRLFGIAYRMLGRVADAEDVVQDVWVRWLGADRARVHDRVAFLVTITTRVALNVAVSARARREIPVDRWLPERIPTSDDPTLAAERSADLEGAFRLLLERLSPTERAVFVLREAFEYPFREIAEALEISEANARQLGRRARAHLAEQRYKPVQPAESDRLFRAFLDAARAGDVAGLRRVLVDDLIAHSAENRRTSHSPLVAAVSAAACGRGAMALAVPETRVSHLERQAGPEAGAKSARRGPPGTERQTERRSPDTTTLPNIVLVHGAWADGSSWSARHRAPAGRRLPASRAPTVPTQQAGPTTSPGCVRCWPVPGRADHRRRALLRRPDHHRARPQTPPTAVGLVYIAAFGLDQGESLGLSTGTRHR